MAVIAIMLPRVVRALNGFLLGEAEAFHLGIDVERMKWLIVVVTAAVSVPPSRLRVLSGSSALSYRTSSGSSRDLTIGLFCPAARCSAGLSCCSRMSLRAWP
jgi:hypothetical protein